MFVPTPADKYDLLRRYLSMCEEEMPERLALNKIKQLIGQFNVGLPGSANLRAAIHRSGSPQEAHEHLEAFFTPYIESEAVAG